MDKQKVFDTVVNHLMTQKARSMKKITHELIQGQSREAEVCVYRGKDGLKCAIGPLIKEEFFNPDFNCKPVEDIYVQQMLCKSLDVPSLSKFEVKMLMELQVIHDLDPIEKWEASLKKAAIDFGVTFNYHNAEATGG